MKNAALLLGVWLGIILFAYSVVYLPGEAPGVALARETEVIDARHAFTLPLPTGWAYRSGDAAAVLVAPVDGLEAWVLRVPVGPAEAVLAAAWEILDPCSSCERPAVMASAPLEDGRDGLSLDLGPDGEAWTGWALLLLADADDALLLLVRQAPGTDLPARVAEGLARIGDGLRFLPAPEPVDGADPDELGFAR